MQCGRGEPELSIQRHFAQTQHTKHERCIQNENELGGKKSHRGWKQGRASTSADGSKLHFQEVNMGVKSHPVLLSLAEVEIFVFLLIFYFRQGNALPHPLGD